MGAGGPCWSAVLRTVNKGHGGQAGTCHHTCVSDHISQQPSERNSHYCTFIFHIPFSLVDSNPGPQKEGGLEKTNSSLTKWTQYKLPQTLSSKVSPKIQKTLYFFQITVGKDKISGSTMVMGIE